jgi:hypothetical protein
MGRNGFRSCFLSYVDSENTANQGRAMQGGLFWAAPVIPVNQGPVKIVHNPADT